ncbi:glycosyltransferase family A protein [Pedobacter frigidisoli]|uniref:glycosyltransferase family 2 protein n=1 Tax=Pedobacter frigidisoli TaxID=2530455 RepID=UPI00292CAE31|nr:glycosyltransferase family A protein [Pedobacter frigidisoli]
MFPLISICIPAHNCGLYIADTLTSLCNQSYRKLEIIVVNDGSKDDTLAQINTINDPRIFVFSINRSGAASARNLAYQKSTGEYIIFFDGDDLIPKDFIQLQVESNNYQRDVVVVSGWGRFYHDDTESFKEEPIFKEELSFKQWILRYWQACNPMTTPGRILMHRSIVDQAGLWNERLNLNDDLEFFTRVFLKTSKIIMNPAALFFYRSGIKGLSDKKGEAAYHSLYHSVYLSTQYAIKAYGEQENIKTCCANMLQSCIYEIYPTNKPLIKEIERHVISLGGSSIKPESGGITFIFNSIFGWKLTKRIKALLDC